MIHLLETSASVPTLATVWFLLATVLWLGYFFLEGFDYGVAMLIRVLGKNEKERRVVVNTIGPLWDGNEVWLLTAGGATFAAFPGWYATLFSGLYIPLFLILFGVGLGLALARDTARSLGGDLKLEFGTLGGASFLLTIPKS